jgi:glycosyltransferase involved in cell wall biosynthesis
VNRKATRETQPPGTCDLGLGTLLYVGGIDLPTPQARAVQSLHTAYALAAQGCNVILAVGRAERLSMAKTLADYGLAPDHNLTILALPTLRLPHLPISAYVHPRLAVWNWSYGLAAVVAVRLLPAVSRPRVVLARDPRLAWLFLRARAWTQADVVYEVHELFSTRAREPVAAIGKDPPVRTPRVRCLEQTVFRNAAGLITLTKACRQLIVDEFGVRPQRILVAPDAVSSVPGSLPPRRVDTRTIVYAGHLYPWKGPATLIRALALVPEARLKIVGGHPGRDSNAEAIRSLARDLGVFERVELSGFLPHAQVASAIVGAAAGVAPLPDNPMSRYFTSPLKLYEYMAAGVPIVASDLPAIREVLRHGHNALLVPPDEPAALAAALQRLLSEPQLADRLRAQAFADVAGCTWAARAQAIASFLAGII